MIGIALQMITGGFRKALGWATSSVTHILAVALLAALVWGWLGHRNAAKWEKVLRSTEVAMRAAEREATANQIAANQAQEARWAAQSRKVDHDYQTALDRSQRAADSYIAANRVQRHGASCPGGGDTVPRADTAGSADSASAEAEMVTVTPDDIKICTANTERLSSARDWALGL